MKETMSNRGSRNSKVMESTDPVSMLKEDHKNVKDLFDEFENTDDERTQMQLAKRAINELKVHAAIEEEIFYPGVREKVDDTELMSEATEEHHVAHFLIDELDGRNLDHDTFHAKFIVLAENVRHHIKEEEGEMFPKIDADEDEMQELAGRMAERKQQLMENPDALNRKPSKSSSKTRTGTSATMRSQSRSNGGNKKTGKSETGRSRPSSPRASR
jgi:hemerythrin superfamily protein